MNTLGGLISIFCSILIYDKLLFEFDKLTSGKVYRPSLGIFFRKFLVFFSFLCVSLLVKLNDFTNIKFPKRYFLVKEIAEIGIITWGVVTSFKVGSSGCELLVHHLDTVAGFMPS